MESNSINETSFTSLYTKLYNENFNELESLRNKDKKRALSVIIFVAILFVSFFLMSFNVILGIIGFIGIFVYILYASKPSKNINKTGGTYKDVFKNKIIYPMIQHILPDSEYYPLSGMSRAEYFKGEWENCDVFDSEDKIVTKIKIDDNNEMKASLVMSEVHTRNKHKDSEGRTSYTTLFYGIAGQVNLPKDIGCYIKVVDNKFNLFFKNHDKLEMDMAEFEKVFDVETDNKIKAMQILTADIMTDLLDLVNSSKVKFEFYIKNDVMYIRFHTGEMFEPNIFGKTMQLNILKRNFDIINGVKIVTKHICNVIMNTEV